MAGDDPLVGGGHHEDVDQDNLLTPVVLFPELLVAMPTRKPVRYELKMIVSYYHHTFYLLLVLWLFVKLPQERK